jgi:hypothetical protein
MLAWWDLAMSVKLEAPGIPIEAIALGKNPFGNSPKLVTNMAGFIWRLTTNGVVLRFTGKFKSWI